MLKWVNISNTFPSFPIFQTSNGKNRDENDESLLDWYLFIDNLAPEYSRREYLPSIDKLNVCSTAEFET